MVEAEVIAGYLMYAIVPLWIGAGLADWACHRTVGIEHTAGAKESWLHLLLLAEIGIPICAALFLEINALVLLVSIVAFFVHHATSSWDLAYATRMRKIGVVEQHVHSFLEVLPFTALSFIIVLHWPQFLALFGLGEEPADFSVRLKEQALPTGYVAGVLAAVVLLDVLPFVEELRRGLRARRSGR